MLKNLFPLNQPLVDLLGTPYAPVSKIAPVKVLPYLNVYLVNSWYFRGHLTNICSGIHSF